MVSIGDKDNLIFCGLLSTVLVIDCWITLPQRLVAQQNLTPFLRVRRLGAT